MDNDRNKIIKVSYSILCVYLFIYLYSFTFIAKRGFQKFVENGIKEIYFSKKNLDILACRKLIKTLEICNMKKLCMDLKNILS